MKTITTVHKVRPGLPSFSKLGDVPVHLLEARVINLLYKYARAEGIGLPVKLPTESDVARVAELLEITSSRLWPFILLKMGKRGEVVFALPAWADSLQVQKVVESYFCIYRVIGFCKQTYHLGLFKVFKFAPLIVDNIVFDLSAYLEMIRFFDSTLPMHLQFVLNTQTGRISSEWCNTKEDENADF
jgi:hypothetical protein